MAMTEQQLEFWRSLTAKFPRGSYKQRAGSGGQTFTYLEPRAIENRLDDVVGPDGWDLLFEETGRGVIAKLVIEVPAKDGGIKKVSRSWGESFGDNMNDQDASYKTAFSNAVKACASKFGIGRELYGQGMPAYCADLHNAPASGLPQSGPGNGAPVAQGSPPAPPDRSVFGDAPGGSQGPSGQGPGKPPFGKAGTKAPYAWAMVAGDYYHVKVVDWMVAYAKQRKQKSYRTDEWDEAFLDECLAATLAWIKTLPNYGGEFGDSRPAQPEFAEYGTPDIVKLKLAISAAATALIHKKTGRKPTEAEVIGTIIEISGSVADGQGRRGEVINSLRDCQDHNWLKHMLNLLTRQIKEVAEQEAQAPPDDDIPF